jgi:hypothetical protein
LLKQSTKLPNETHYICPLLRKEQLGMWGLKTSKAKGSLERTGDEMPREIHNNKKYLDIFHNH